LLTAISVLGCKDFLPYAKAVFLNRCAINPFQVFRHFFLLFGGVFYHIANFCSFNVKMRSKMKFDKCSLMFGVLPFVSCQVCLQIKKGIEPLCS
jgi:hypothetical protein